jgi:multidrug transporter EmrE-like cation transporter
VSGSVLLVLCVLLSAGASYFLKLGAMANAGKSDLTLMATNPMILLGALCYAIAFVGYMLALQKVQLSLAQPAITAGVSVVTAILSVIFLKELMSPSNWLGLVLVCTGIYLLFLGKV